MLTRNVSRLILSFVLLTLVFSVVSQRLYAAPAGDANLFLPVILNGDPIQPVGGTCVDGMHLVHKSTGAAGIVQPDSVLYDDNDYVCHPDQSCEDIGPAAYGTCSVLDGIAVLSCDEGYVGAQCDICAEGYKPNPAGDACVPAPTPPSAIILSGFELSIEQGHVRILTASLSGINSFTWEITSGPGCFIDPNGLCASTTDSTLAFFRAAGSGDDIQLTEIRVTPGCCIEPPPPPAIGTVITVIPDSIPTSGWGDADLEPILRVLRDFMYHRCVGAATIGISYYGVPVGVWGLGRMEGAPAEVWDEDCGNDPFLDADPVSADTPMSIGSITKSVTAAVTRWKLHQRIMDETGLDLNDHVIEALHVFSNNPGIPFHLFPDDLYGLYSGQNTPPMILPDDIFYTDGEQTITPLCTTLTSQADEQWQDVTVGQLLAHRSGMQDGTTFAVGLMGNIGIFRNLEDEGDYVAQEAQLRAIYGDALVDAAKTSLGYAAGTEVYFVPAGTLQEYLTQLSGLCLRFDLGIFYYTNRSPFMWSMIVEEMHGGLYMAAAGDPASHEGSALDEFFDTVLGISTSGDSGIFRQQPAINIPGYSYPGPVRRHWDGSSYYPEGWDEKRPHCIWSNASGCSFSAWNNTNPGRINWDWQLEPVPFDRVGSGLPAPAGSLQTEAEVFLRFMSEFWVGGYLTDPRIGQTRQNVWNLFTEHNGKTDGTYAKAVQLGNGSPNQWQIPPVTASGHITDDFVNLVNYSCSLPDGVDFFVAVNQVTDPKTIPGVPAYDPLLRNFILYGICQVDWTHVMPTLPIIPPVP